MARFDPSEAANASINSRWPVLLFARDMGTTICFCTVAEDC